MLKEWELLTPEIERKKEKILINKYWVIVFESLFWEFKNIYDYLNLNQEEKNMVEDMENMWYKLIWEREKDEKYPEYIKTFIEENIWIIKTWEEVNFKRENWNDLIFIRINIQKPVSEEITEEILDTQKAFEKILWDLPKRFI